MIYKWNDFLLINEQNKIVNRIYEETLINIKRNIGIYGIYEAAIAAVEDSDLTPIVTNTIEESIKTSASVISIIINECKKQFAAAVDKEIITKDNINKTPSPERVEELTKLREKYNKTYGTTKTPILTTAEFENRPEDMQLNDKDGGIGNLIKIIRFDVTKKLVESKYYYIYGALINSNLMYIDQFYGINTFAKIFTQILKSKKDIFDISNDTLSINTHVLEGVLKAVLDIKNNPIGGTFVTSEQWNTLKKVYTEKLKKGEEVKKEDITSQDNFRKMLQTYRYY